MPSESKFSRLSAVYISLKYKYLCNLLYLLPAEAKECADPSTCTSVPMMLPKWGQQASMVCWDGPLFYWWWKPPKEQKPQEIKMTKRCRLFMWKLERQWSIICCAVEVVAGTAPVSVHRKMLLLYVCPSLYNWATLLSADARCGHCCSWVASNFAACDQWITDHKKMWTVTQLLAINVWISTPAISHTFTAILKNKSLERQHPKVQCQKLCNFILFPLPSTLDCTFVTLWLWMGGTGNSSLHASSQSCYMENIIFPVSSEDRRSSKQQLSWLIKKTPTC